MLHLKATASNSSLRYLSHLSTAPDAGCGIKHQLSRYPSMHFLKQGLCNHSLDSMNRSPQVVIYVLEIYMLYSIPMYLQHESRPKRLRIVYLPPAIVVGFKNPNFQTLISIFFRWCFSKDNNRVSLGPFSEKTL